MTQTERALGRIIERLELIKAEVARGSNGTSKEFRDVSFEVGVIARQLEEQAVMVEEGCEG